MLKLTRNEKCEMTSGIIDIFERFLKDKDIVIENPEKKGDDTEANIYGSDYYSLEDSILEYFYNTNKVERRDVAPISHNDFWNCLRMPSDKLRR